MPRRKYSKKRRGNSRIPNVVLEEIPTPEELIQLYLDDVSEGKPITEDTWQTEAKRNVVKRLFGDEWNEFVRAAIDFSHERYRDVYLFARARHYFYTRGRRPSMRSWQSPPSITYILKRYQSWSNFLKEAGIQTDQIWTDEILINLLRRAYNDLGRSPTTLDLLNEPLKQYMPSYMVFANHFGKVKTGPDGEPIRKPIMKNDPDNEGREKVIYVVQKELASWNEVLEKAGLPALPQRESVSFSSEELIDYVKRLAELLGRAPRPKDIDNLYRGNLQLREEARSRGEDPDEKYPHVPSLSAYYNGGRFRWADVMRAADMINQWIKEIHFPDPTDDYRSVEIMDSIEMATKMLDGEHVPTLQQYLALREQHEDTHLSSFYTIKKFYGSYGAAIHDFLRQNPEYKNPVRKRTKKS